MVSPECQVIALAQVVVSLRMYDVLVFVADVQNFAKKGKEKGGDYLAPYQEYLDPEPHFKRALLTRQLVPDLTR